MNDLEECYDCGGDIGTEVVGRFRDHVCEDCGLIVDSEEVIEEQEEYIEKDIEIME